jgi:hypothetical protein
MNSMKNSSAEDQVWETFFAICGEVGNEAFTEQIRQRLGMRALAHQVERMENGCPRAIKDVADRCLGLPEAPFSARIDTMSADEVRQALRERYAERLRAKGLDESIADVLVSDGKEAE